MTPGVWNILDLIDNFGDDSENEIISDFSTQFEKNGNIQNLNPDIESFLKKNAIQFAKEKKSITYIVGDKDDGSLLGYFTITHKPIEIPAIGLSKTTIRKLEKHSNLKETENVYVVSASLIAQFGKNYAVDHGNRITGSELMKLADKELLDVQRKIGGSVKYLDCEADAKLIRFYQKEQEFALYGERISGNDGKRYLQFMKFL